MRLDAFLYSNGYYPSRNKAAEAISRGEVAVDGKKVVKPSFNANDGAKIKITGVNYVSVGAYKMNRAIEVFNFDCKDKVFADIGASTGGFTQSLLLNGAKRVYCVDVGENQLDASLSSDDRVVVMDRTNARYLNKHSFPEELYGAVVDCSFISLKIILPVIKKLISPFGAVIALVKPQFECGKNYLGKSGVLTDKAVRKRVVADLYNFCVSLGFSVKDFTYSPLNEKKNVEYLVYLDFSGSSVGEKYVLEVVDEADGKTRD